MSASSTRSGPVFIDVQVILEKCQLHVPSEIPVVIPDSLNTKVKVEPEPESKKTELGWSPVATLVDIQPRRIRCTECNKYTAENEEKMLQHVMKVHRTSLFDEHVRIHQDVTMSASSTQSGPVAAEQCPLNVPNEISVVSSGSLSKDIKSESTDLGWSPVATLVDIQPPRIRCTECNKFTAENEEKMLQHVRKVHRGENAFQCYMCDYSTYNKSLFEEHVRIHQGIKPFKCSHCPYRSASKKNTKKHELIHRADNPRKCQQCGFIARHIKALQCHLNKKHNQSRTLKTCPYCYRKFEDIDSHVKNLVKCSKCSKSKFFCAKGLLNKHMITAHGETAQLKMSKADFVCAICKWSSNVKPKILLHLIHHPNQPVDENVIDVRILKECGIVGQGW